MTTTRKVYSIALILALAASSMLWIQSTSAQSIPKPSVPEFTLQLASYPYNVPPVTTTTIDQYTGKQTTITTPGYYVENKSIEITIVNQAFSPSADGLTYHLYYNFRVKGHFAEDWKELYTLKTGTNSQDNVYVESLYVPAGSPLQSSSDQTVLSISTTDYPSDAQLDFQVQAIIGHDSQVWIGDHPLQPMLSGHYESAIAFDSKSNWSSTQTIDIGKNTAVTEPTTAPTQSTQTPTQTVPATSPTQMPTAIPQDAQTNLLSGLDWEKAAIVGLVVVVAVLAVAMVIMWRKMAITKS